MSETMNTGKRISIPEVLRYLGAGRNAPPALREQVEQTARQVMSNLRPRWTWRVFSLSRENSQNREGSQESDTFSLHAAGNEKPALLLTGKTAETMLSSCDRAVLLACTLGAEFDRLLRSVQARAMSEAVIVDACGSAWVEAGCGAAEAEIAARFPGQYLTDRFSPGYGDLPLTLQRDLCALLDTPRRLGVHVTESLLLNPSKSVTAVIGISDRPQMARVRGCGCCTLRETCSLRKGGRRCTI